MGLEPALGRFLKDENYFGIQIALAQASIVTESEELINGYPLAVARVENLLDVRFQRLQLARPAPSPDECDRREDQADLREEIADDSVQRAHRMPRDVLEFGAALEQRGVAVMLPSSRMIALMPVLATRIIGILVSTERIAAIARS